MIVRRLLVVFLGFISAILLFHSGAFAEIGRSYSDKKSAKCNYDISKKKEDVIKTIAEKQKGSNSKEAT